MQKKKKTLPPSSTRIEVGDISRNSGPINIAGRDVKTTHITSGVSPAEQERLFALVYQAIEERTQSNPTEKQDLAAEVKEVEQAVQKPVVDESFVARRLRNISRMAPDILEVVIATITNPAMGLGLLGKKIAEKAREGTDPAASAPAGPGPVAPGAD